MKSITIDQLDVLLVEPSTTQQRIIDDHLAAFGVRSPTNVRDAASALTRMEGTPPDLVISAMHLPDMTGTDLVRTMRARERLRDIAFMLVSSETDIRYLEPLRQAGVIAILPKPFEAHQLQRSLYTTLDFLEPDALDLRHYTPDELRVLIVDDSTTSRHFVRQVLERMGIEQFSEAADGRAAQQLIDREFFDLIVTDYHMPEMDGRELIAYIRAQSSQPSVPVLMVTGESDSNRLAALEQSGVSAIFDKPFDVDTLRTIIEKALV
ncbi:MAG: response regulator [Gammaproteobacteria bacterium]